MLPASKKMRRDGVLIEAFYKSMGGGEVSAGFSPTIGGAQAWLSRHRDDLNTALRLIQMYPLLIKEECLDGFWTFLQPMLQQICVARKDDTTQVQCQHCRNTSRRRLGSWESIDDPSPSVRGGHLVAPTVKPSM